MQPLQHLILILIAWWVCQLLPRIAGVHVLSLLGLAFVGVYAPAAAIIIVFVITQAALMVAFLRQLKRSSNWRKYLPYLLLVNLLTVDLQSIALTVAIETLAISFSTVRIFITVKQLLNTRKELPITSTYWIFPAAFFLPAVVIGPVFSGTLLRDQYNQGATQNVTLEDNRKILQGLVLSVLASPFFGKYDLFFLQLFAAFWGQSLIAEHTSRYFGYKLPVNFDRPWKAKTIKEFWGRWHRSMANFVLQYIFLPLQLSGISPKLATISAFVFMGVWHNLSLGYLVWGITHGTLLAYNDVIFKRIKFGMLSFLLTWTAVVSLSWFANIGPWS